MERVLPADRSENKIPLISFLGPEGSGKSTQAKLLAEKYRLPYISTGDMIRDAAANDMGELGEACRKMFEEHSYLSGDLLLKIVAARFQREDTKNGLILDGGFRTLKETQNFAEMLESVDRNFSVKVVFLRTPGWESVDRLKKRKRSDDTSEAILSRLTTFYTDLGKRVSFIRKTWDFAIIMAANKSVSDLNREITDLFGLPRL